MRATAKTPEGRLRQYIILKCRQHQRPEEWMYAEASAEVGRTLVSGFGLTTCSKPELVRIADRITRAVGEAPMPHRRGPRGTGNRAQRDRTGVVTYLASREQRDLILALGAEIFGSGEAPAFRAFLVGMTGKSDVRLLASNQAAKTIEALTAMAKRGWRPRSSAAGGGSDVTSVPLVPCVPSAQPAAEGPR